MSRLVKTMLTSLAVLLIIAIAAIVVLININKDNLQADAEPTIDEIIEYSYESPEITTDLKDGSFVRIQFQIVTDSKEAKEEISKRDFQLKNILIKELATMEEENFKSGLGDLEEKVKISLNELMAEGTVTDVYTINKILQ
ncbi:flagellar basal body-associated protein FliL [Oceanobacillus piezotolerans]|uniref:Flagellar protein FliL n=1 Tax=Oceanobacillus piezotolerans TaxID=2448030 RepID=A0A498DEB9_9BACI|nr:flagellar basal body-associated protein FliL [Oceanobacillus piezotolerans]RLL45324.1 flagellar basal body-associated protein FliL [Oceanobacillus piezotolerans]